MAVNDVNHLVVTDGGQQLVKLLPPVRPLLFVMDHSRADIKNALESLDEDLRIYRGLMAKTKQSFKEETEASISASYALWENYDKEKGELQKKVASMVEVLKPLKTQIEEITSMLNSIDTYSVTKFHEAIKGLAYDINVETPTGKMLTFLFQNFKKPKSD